MKTITRKLRTWLLVVLSALCIAALSLGLAACGSGDLKIDVPERIEADLGTGTYIVPHYDVVNENGMIMAGYTVRLKSATDPSGNPAEISKEASTVVTLTGAGEYTFVFTADSRSVSDATVIMDFADRTAPTIKLASSQFPAFFIQNVTYAVPEYTLNGDYVASKCYSKVYYNDGEGEDEEITLTDGSFLVEHSAGKYTILIHVEDAAGNGNDYRYARSVHSPEHYDPNTVIYFNEAFGEKQVAPDGDYAGKFVSVKDGGRAYGEEAGSYKVVFDGSETQNNEAYFALNVPAITNIMAYKELEMYVYIEDENCPNEKTQWVVGSKWWNDTAAKAGEWTRVTWSVENWGNGKGANCGANTSNVISTDNISGTRIRLIPDGDYSNKTHPHGTVYFSAVRAIPYQMSQVTAGDENVTLDRRDGSYHVGDTVTLTAKEQSGQTFDCFLVDGTPIGGNIFVASKDTHTVTTKYITGELTAENMTWGTTDTYRTAGSDAKAQKLGSDTHWVLTYRPEFEESGWVYTAAYVGGNDQLFGIEMNSDGDSRKLSGYGGAWKGDVAIPVSEAVRDMLRASKTTPATMIYVRNGEMIYAYLQKDTETVFLGSVAFSVFGVSGDGFGIGERAGTIQNAALENIKWVSGELRTNLYLGTLGVTLEKTDVTTERDSYFLGETVKLVANNAPEGKAFSYFLVDDVKIEGDTFTATKFSHKVKAYYDDISELTLESGIETANGKTTVGKGATVTLVFNGASPEGKYFKGFKVDGAALTGNTFVATENTHSVTAEFADKVVSGNVQLNDMKGGKKQNSDSATLEYVTNKKYDGVDGDVKENGSLKVTGIGGDNLYIYTGTALGTLDLTNYKEVYFYVWAQSAGAKGGTWWCNDTALAAGIWTKISVYKNANLNENGGKPYDADGVNGKLFAEGSTGSNFVFRIMNGQNNTFYITSLYGIPFPDVEVTVDEAVKNYVSVSGSFKEDQVITLSVNGAPEHKAFKCFTVNGEELAPDATTYKIKASDVSGVTVGAVFTDVSALTLGDGITTSDGKTQYGMGVTVTLVFDENKTPSGELFDYFTVDSERIAGNTFVTSATSHTVSAVFVDSAEKLTWVTSTEAAGSDVTYSWPAYQFNGKAVGESDHWAIEAKAYGFTGLGDKWFSLDFLVGDNASLQIRLHSAGNANIQAMGANHSDGTNLKDLEASVIDLCKAATEQNPVTFTAIRNGDTYYVLLNGNLILKTQFAFNVSGNKFGIGGTDCGAWLTAHPAVSYKYRTGEALADYLTTVNVSGTNVTFDKADGVYKLGDTVTLTPATAPNGQTFSHFKVDGKEFTGTSFVVTKRVYTVETVYADISTLTLGEGVATSDGKTVYARGAKVKLSFDPAKLNGQVADYYLIDKGTENEVRIYNGEFTTSAATHTVEAVLVNPDAITWADGGASYDYETVMGADASVWKSRNLDSGEVYGSAEYWAVSVNVKFTEGWKSIEFIQGTKQSIRLRFHSDNFFGIILIDDSGEEKTPGSEFVDAFPNQNAEVVNKLKAGATVTCVRNGNTITMYVDGYLLFTTNYAVDHTGNWFGVGHVVDSASSAAKPDTMDTTKYITGKDKVEAYLAALAESGTVPQSEAQINTLKGATSKKGSTVEYITEGIPEGLSDENVKESGVLKVTAKTSDVGLTAGWTFDKDTSAYDELYYYVYIESDDSLTNVSAGAYWKDNTQIVAKTWVKVTLDSTMIAELDGGANTDLSKITMRIYSQTWIDGYTAIQGKTIYVTSLYGTPKTTPAT